MTGVFRMLCTQQVATLQRLIEYGLVDRQEANHILPNMSFPPSSDGESLMVRPITHTQSDLTLIQWRYSIALHQLQNRSYELLPMWPATLQVLLEL